MTVLFISRRALAGGFVGQPWAGALRLIAKATVVNHAMDDVATSRRVLLLALAGLLGFVAPERADAAPPDAPAAAELLTVDRSEGLNRLVTQIILDTLPEEMVYDDKWGGTTEVWDGVRMRWEGNRLTTKRRWKTVNQGTWKRYEIRLIDPDQHFHVSVHNLEELPEGRVGFETRVDAALDLFGRLSEWQRGVQLFSLSATATAVVRLEVRCTLAMHLDPTRLPPDVILDPRVKGADLHLIDFQLHRISEARGPLVRELGRSAQGVLEQQVARRRERLVARINRQIDRRRDDLRLSLYDLLNSRWGDLAARQLE